MPEHTPAPTPSRAVYGFAMYLSFKTFFILYLLWAIVPEEWFIFVGITCLPQRYWAVSIPIFFLNVLTVFAFVIYPSLGFLMIPSVDDIRTIEDSADIRQKNATSLSLVPETVISSECCVHPEKCFRRQYNNECADFINKCIPAVQGLNMWEVSDHLYMQFNK